MCYMAFLLVSITGDIVERQELLNGTQTITIEGVSDDGAWTLVGSVSWNRGLIDYPGEGDMTLSRQNGDEVFATLTAAEVTDVEDEIAVDHLMRLRYEVDGGAGCFAGASGHVRAEASLAGEHVGGTWALSLVA